MKKYIKSSKEIKVSSGCLVEMTVGKYTRYTQYVNVVFDWVQQITGDTELAIDASSWCELASVGETYETPKFVLTIIEEN